MSVSWLLLKASQPADAHTESAQLTGAAGVRRGIPTTTSSACQYCSAHQTSATVSVSARSAR